jgi:hypothetical protein
MPLIEAAVESLDCTARRAACDRQLVGRQLAVNQARRTPKGPEREALVAAAEARDTPACEALLRMYDEVRSTSEAFKASASGNQRKAPVAPSWAAAGVTFGMDAPASANAAAAAAA